MTSREFYSLQQIGLFQKSEWILFSIGFSVEWEVSVSVQWKVGADHSVQLYWLETLVEVIFVSQKVLKSFETRFSSSFKHAVVVVVVKTTLNGCFDTDSARQYVIFLDEKLFLSWFHRDVADRPAQDNLVVIV